MPAGPLDVRWRKYDRAPCLPSGIVDFRICRVCLTRGHVCTETRSLLLGVCGISASTCSSHTGVTRGVGGLAVQRARLVLKRHPIVAPATPENADM